MMQQLSTVMNALPAASGGKGVSLFAVPDGVTERSEGNSVAELSILPSVWRGRRGQKAFQGGVRRWLKKN